MLTVTGCGGTDDDANAGRTVGLDAEVCSVLNVSRTVPVPPPATASSPIVLRDLLENMFDFSLPGEPAVVFVLVEPTSPAELGVIQEAVAAIPGVEAVEVLDQEEAYESFVRLFADMEHLIGNVDRESVPPQIEVRVGGDESLEDLRGALEDRPGVRVVFDDRLNSTAPKVELLEVSFAAELAALESGEETARSAAVGIRRIAVGETDDVGAVRDAVQSLLAEAEDDC